MEEHTTLSDSNPDGPHWAHTFLCHCLNSVDYTNFITGTTRYKLTQAEMAKILLPTPPLAEQQRIVQAIAQYNSILELISK